MRPRPDLERRQLRIIRRHLPDHRPPPLDDRRAQHVARPEQDRRTTNRFEIDPRRDVEVVDDEADAQTGSDASLRRAEQHTPVNSSRARMHPSARPRCTAHRASDLRPCAIIDRAIEKSRPTRYPSAVTRATRFDRFLRAVVLLRDKVPSFDIYPFSIPAIRALDELSLDASVTFFVGDNGSGKSTLVEAVAVAAGFNAEGGSRNFKFATRSSESELHRALRLVRGVRRVCLVATALRKTKLRFEGIPSRALRGTQAPRATAEARDVSRHGGALDAGVRPCSRAAPLSIARGNATIHIHRAVTAFSPAGRDASRFSRPVEPTHLGRSERRRYSDA
jgi:hypothetical protein